MNLYEFSQQNNNEMGIYISKEQDPELYTATYDEAQRLLTISEEIRVTVKKVTADTPSKTEAKKAEATYSKTPVHKKLTGYCIRTGVEIPFSLEKPMCYDAYKSWSKYEDGEFKEKYCHFSGEQSYGETSYNKPILKKNWKKAQEMHGI